MDIDTDKIDQAVLALPYLTLHDGVRAWKGHDWDALDRLYRKGMIDNPVGPNSILAHLFTVGEVNGNQPRGSTEFQSHENCIIVLSDGNFRADSGVKGVALISPWG